MKSPTVHRPKPVTPVPCRVHTRPSRPPRTERLEPAAHLENVNQIEAIIGPDGLLRGYIIRGRFTNVAHLYLSAAHGKESDWVWSVEAARRWGATSVFGRRSWLDSQVNVFVPPTGGVLLRIFA